MPSKERDADVNADDRMRDKARRSKSERKPDRDRDRPHRSSKSARSSSDTHSLTSSSTRRHRNKEADRDRDRDKDKDRLPPRPASMSDLGVDAMPRPPADKDRISLPYPSFNKAHSKEAVVSREDIASSASQQPRAAPPNPLTPEATDFGGGGGGGGRGGDEERRSKPGEDHRLPHRSASKKASRPPTPPETDVSAAAAAAAAKKKRAQDPDRGDKSTLSRSASRAAAEDKSSRVSRRSSTSAATLILRSPTNKFHDKLRSSVLSRSSSSASRHASKRSSSTRSAKKSKPEPLHVDSSPSSAQDSSPKTPTQAHQFPSHLYGGDSKPSRAPASGLANGDDYASAVAAGTATPAMKAPTHPPPPIPPPPPPPPPAVDALEIPRVDYLLQNGGLPQPVTRHFLSVLPVQSGGSRAPSSSPLSGAETLFTPFVGLLDQYQTVLSRQGSVAVATGHRSVARRLLDRLENVFSRDLPPHGCSCVLCDKSNEPHRGLNWGDVLEWVSGRIQLPPWPPFDLADMGAKAAEISGETPRRPESPIQLDPDIAEEFREHYLRQSKKVRSAVDRWLHSTGETPVPPPQEVDDETLSFAILTNLDADDRPYFNALLAGSKEPRPATRAPTPPSRPRNDFMVKTGLSLQRLYRLQQAPRDAESATYLIRNPHAHDLLVTLSNINGQEWEILTSGRFDGFLWSGADDDFGGPEPRGPTPFSRGPLAAAAAAAMGSRANTPFSPYSRGATPASFVSLASSGMGGSRPPVSNDEEMEMAAIAEIEREIYQGMEALEDAFEKLHHQAETVRTALRQRGAGLMQNLQNRRRIDVLSIPGSGNSQNSAYERPAWAGSDADNASDDDWQMEEYDLYPDDSASNISSSRHRRPKRRVERRTPAAIEEEEE
ncbi:hypothetical protein Trco_003627 [Trichoderma cornu-damae]|uniref:5-Methylcytosine G/T mismatch-specific DNA glycosylase n=1 Tax=Trichoderma cornu-damae TaxID=654480 RepID=A0A9P8TXG8_9HYPO|nr:hypothetical protein Trco_003627 [Trichoderma cornu-damae]